MGKVHVDDSNVEAGTYKVKFVSFTHRNEADEPVAKSVDSGMRLFGNLEIVDGPEEGAAVPFSTDLEAGIVAWCKLLTGRLPESKKLIDIEKQLQSHGHVVEMSVNDSGWARGPVVKKGGYLAKFVGFTKRDENDLPLHVEAEYNKKTYRKVFMQFMVASGDSEGLLVPASCSYALKIRGEDLELKSKTNMYSWFMACGIAWDNLPAWKNSENILPELEKVLLAADRLVMIQVGDTGWVESDQSSIGPAPEGISLAGAPKVEPEKKSPEALFDLYQLMRKIAEEKGLGELFDQSGELTDAGKTFARDKIGPICVERDIPRHFGKMSEKQIKLVASELEFNELGSASAKVEEAKAGDEAF